jgi:hypothetical protein
MKFRTNEERKAAFAHMNKDLFSLSPERGDLRADFRAISGLSTREAIECLEGFAQKRSFVKAGNSRNKLMCYRGNLKEVGVPSYNESGVYLVED